jgi:hypothetical protein
MVSANIMPQRCHDCHDCHLSLRIPETLSFAHYNKNIYIFIIVADFDNPFSLMTIMTNDNHDNNDRKQRMKNA